MAHELVVPIWNHAFRDAMEPHNLLEVEISHLGGIISRLASKEMRHFEEAINYNRDGILLSLSPREDGDEV